MRKIAVCLAFTALCAFTAPAYAGEKYTGYLAADAFDILKVLPPAPQAGDARYESDRKIFRDTRKLIGTPRWDMATSDVKTDDATLLLDFSCAVGATLTPENAPKTLHVFKRAMVDTGHGTEVAKNHYQRLRPFQIDEGQICQPPAELAGKSFDYPSGHTTRGWTLASILAQLAPDHATAILARGRAYGESRVVCGAHNASAVEAGRLSAGMTLAVVAASAEFQKDIAAAKTEIGALRTTSAAPAPAVCQSERDLVDQRIPD